MWFIKYLVNFYRFILFQKDKSKYESQNFLKTRSDLNINDLCYVIFPLKIKMKEKILLRNYCANIINIINT